MRISSPLPPPLLNLPNVMRAYMRTAGSLLLRAFSVMRSATCSYTAQAWLVSVRQTSMQQRMLTSTAASLVCSKFCVLQLHQTQAQRTPATAGSKACRAIQLAHAIPSKTTKRAKAEQLQLTCCRAQVMSRGW
jgi:hypothetical protein